MSESDFDGIGEVDGIVIVDEVSFDDSLLSSIESSLCKGPISFDYYPNITISLKEKNVLKSMILQIKTHNYKMIKWSIPVA